MTKPPMLHQCCRTIHGPRVTSWECQRAGVVKDPEGWHCVQHSDAAYAARAKKTAAKYAEVTKRADVRWAKMNAYGPLRALTEAVAYELAVDHPLARQAKAVLKKIDKDLR